MATVAALATADPMADSNAAAVRGPRHPHGHEHPFAMPAALTASPPAHGFLAKASPHHGDAPLPVHGHAQHHHGHHHGPYMHAPMGEYALAAAAASAATAAARGQSSPPLPPPSSTSSSGQPHADMHGLSGDAMPDYLNAALAVGGADGIHGPLHHGPHVLHGLPTNPLAATSPTATSASSRATATAAPSAAHSVLPSAVTTPSLRSSSSSSRSSVSSSAGGSSSLPTLGPGGAGGVYTSPHDGVLLGPSTAATSTAASTPTAHGATLPTARLDGGLSITDMCNATDDDDAAPIGLPHALSEPGMTPHAPSSRASRSSACSTPHPDPDVLLAVEALGALGSTDPRSSSEMDDVAVAAMTPSPHPHEPRHTPMLHDPHHPHHPHHHTSQVHSHPYHEHPYHDHQHDHEHASAHAHEHERRMVTSQHAAAAASVPATSEPSGEPPHFIHRVSSLPLVTSSISRLGTAYEATKNTHRIVRYSAESVEVGVMRALSGARSTLTNNLAGGAGAIVGELDRFACHQLDRLERSFPRMMGAGDPAAHPHHHADPHQIAEGPMTHDPRPDGAYGDHAHAHGYGMGDHHHHHHHHHPHDPHGGTANEGAMHGSKDGRQATDAMCTPVMLPSDAHAARFTSPQVSGLDAAAVAGTPATAAGGSGGAACDCCAPAYPTCAPPSLSPLPSPASVSSASTPTLLHPSWQLPPPPVPPLLHSAPPATRSMHAPASPYSPAAAAVSPSRLSHAHKPGASAGATRPWHRRLIPPLPSIPGIPGLQGIRGVRVMAPGRTAPLLLLLRRSSAATAGSGGLVTGMTGLTRVSVHETLRGIRYCLQWLQYAQRSLERSIHVLRSGLARAVSPLPAPSGSSPAAAIATAAAGGRTGETGGSGPTPPLSPSAAGGAVSVYGLASAASSTVASTFDGLASAMTLLSPAHVAAIRQDVVALLRNVVDVLGRYAAIALPSAEARRHVRGFILELPSRWASVAPAGAEANAMAPAHVLEAAARHEAQRVLTLATESAATLQRVATVFVGFNGIGSQLAAWTAPRSASTGAAAGGDDPYRGLTPPEAPSSTPPLAARRPAAAPPAAPGLGSDMMEIDSA